MFNFDGQYIDFNEDDILEILNDKEADFYRLGCKIKSSDTFDKWLLYYTIQNKIKDAYDSGDFRPKKREVVVPKFAPYVVSDSLGVQGIKSQADGKHYDSRSSYYKSLREQGMVVMGDDAPTTKSSPKTKEIDWKQAVAETIKSTPAKGRR